MTADPPPLVQLQSHENLDKWEVAIQGATETLYAGEHYLLRFRFPEAYPLEAAEVVFVGNVPVHPHVYSNGHICLSILYQRWSPVLTVESVCLSILSMLSSCKQKARVMAKTSPKDVAWQFDAFIIAESYALYLIKMSHQATLKSQWQVPDIQSAVSASVTTYVVYSALFILAQCYIIFLCGEALATQNTIQVIVVVLFYFVCLANSVTRYISMFVWPSLAAHMFTRDNNMFLLQVTVVTMYCIALLALVVLSYKLKKDVGWSVFKRLGADISLHRAFAWHQSLVMILKMDIYFVGSYLIQMTALILKADDIETWLQITVFIPFCIVVIVGAFYALAGERRRLMIVIATCLFLSIGYFIFKIARVCDSSILGKPGDPYADSRPFFMITIVVCMLLVIATGAISIMCIHNFGSGLMEAIAYDKLRMKHRKMYATDKTASDESEQLMDEQGLSPRDRFALD
ncbi:hypothetical protein GGI18_000238 [Coemansia linderi]|uniref:Uncharacterized protein n=1 Tax=Coemansia linderi TaxID=2663919 RepID=A0ACC1KNS3_9FUNG|nr:hypothetical protein GGI18_000238 [Coemansia linderi]